MRLPLLFTLLFNVLILTSLPDLTTSAYLKLRLLRRNPTILPSHYVLHDSQRLSLQFQTMTTKSIKSPVVSGASTGSGQYFVNFRIGSPVQNLLLIADTGSDLIWVKSAPCNGPCSNREPGSVYLPRHSKTFRPFHCYDGACRLVPKAHHHVARHEARDMCNVTREHSTCKYEYTYADGSSTSGFFAKETATLLTSQGREVKMRRVKFGCGFRVTGPSISGESFYGANGVMGLGRGAISFSSQLGKHFGNKFSYCLMDYTIDPPPTSYLFIGHKMRMSKSRNESRSVIGLTPLLMNPLSPTFYYIGIKCVNVDGVKVKLDESVWSLDSDGNGGTVIDSGTTLTFFMEPIYTRLLRAFKKNVVLPMVDDPGLGFDLCVNVSGVSRPKFPRLSFKFVGGSVFSPPSSNYFIDAVEDVKCLAMRPVAGTSGFSVIGNVMQQGFMFEFDRDESKLGFTRHGCALP